jgi:hypothetical protein
MGSKSKLEKAAEKASMKSWMDVDFDLVGVEVADKEPEVYSFDAAVKRKAEIKKAKEELEAEEKALNEALLVTMLASGERKVALWDGLEFEVRRGRSPSKIDPTKLLAAGVPLDTIQESTVAGKEYQYVQITAPPKGKGAENG